MHPALPLAVFAAIADPVAPAQQPLSPMVVSVIHAGLQHLQRVSAELSAMDKQQLDAAAAAAGPMRPAQQPLDGQLLEGLHEPASARCVDGRGTATAAGSTRVQKVGATSGAHCRLPGSCPALQLRGSSSSM